MSATIDTWTGRLGLLTGVCAVAVWLLVAGSPGEAPEPPASIRLGTLATGELEVSPVGRPVLKAATLRPGDSAAGTVRVRNQTPRTLDVALRTTAARSDLDRVALIELSDGKRPFVRTLLGRSRRWSRAAMRLRPDETRTVRVRVWIPRETVDGWQAGRAELTLEFRADVVTGG